MIGTATLLVAGLLLVALGFVRRSRRLGRVVARVGFVTIVLASASIGLECGLALRGDVDLYRIAPVDGSRAAEVFVPDPLLKWRYAPGFRGRFTHPQFAGELFEVNDRGFRDVAWPSEPDPRELRVLVLGDSLTVGLGVTREEAFPALLAGWLKPRTTRPVRVLNAAVAGYGPGEEALVLHELIDGLAPSIVIAAFYDGNDLEDVRHALYNARHVFDVKLVLPGDAGDGGVARPFPGGGRPPAPSPWRRVFGRRSAALLEDRARQVRVRWLGETPAAVFNHTMLRGMLVNDRPIDLEENFEVCAAAMRWMHARAAGAGARFACLRLPAQLQIDPRQWDQLVERLRLDRAQFDVSLPGRALVDTLRQDGVEAFDASEALKPAPGAPRSYFAEGHLNRSGHARIAAFLDAMLVDRGWVGAEAKDPPTSK